MKIITETDVTYYDQMMYYPLSAIKINIGRIENILADEGHTLKGWEYYDNPALNGTTVRVISEGEMFND